MTELMFALMLHYANPCQYEDASDLQVAGQVCSWNAAIDGINNKGESFIAIRLERPTQGQKIIAYIYSDNNVEYAYQD